MEAQIIAVAIAAYFGWMVFIRWIHHGERVNAEWWKLWNNWLWCNEGQAARLIWTVAITVVYALWVHGSSYSGG